jgi:hypothetical protein
MKWTPYPDQCGSVELTWGDLLCLALGYVIRVHGVEVRRNAK